tara:strand:- start:1602 stop:1907 length:306 start_codon:yes stop_codon:yes gene_type:complete
MVCQKCNFDFKEYWLIPHRLLRFKFQRSQRTAANFARTVFWLFVPTLACLAMDFSLALFVVVTIPVATLFTIRTVVALLKNDHLRGIADEPREDFSDESSE